MRRHIIPRFHDTSQRIERITVRASRKHDARRVLLDPSPLEFLNAFRVSFFDLANSPSSAIQCIKKNIRLRRAQTPPGPRRTLRAGNGMGSKYTMRCKGGSLCSVQGGSTPGGGALVGAQRPTLESMLNTTTMLSRAHPVLC
jgi:hypothetical protein